MFLARVVGTVVATRKDPKLKGYKLLLVTPVDPNDNRGTDYVVAVDTVNAGYKETVIVVRGSSARMADGLNERPVDAAIVGIVDTADLDE